ncbi:MAG: chromosomal replication initiator protein DnaA [Fimbriimonadaceae bacterium]
MPDQYSLDQSESEIQFQEIWKSVVDRSEDAYTAYQHRYYIQNIQPLGFEDGVAKLGVPGQFAAQWVKRNFVEQAQEMLAELLGAPVKLEIRTLPNPKKAGERKVSANAVEDRLPNGFGTFQPNPNYSFEKFIVGDSNRMAAAGARAVATQPGKVYNPLFIYGSSGLGKTHLLHAIALAALRIDPNMPIVYVTAQQFAEEFVKAVQTNTIDKFRKSQRSGALWLIDDVQFIVGKTKTQEEIFHTYNHLFSMGRQIVLTSDKPPKELFTVDERLRSRFEMGLVVDVQQPDVELRCAIIRDKAQDKGIPIDDEVAMLLAEEVRGNIRVLEGALAKLAIQSSLLDVPISMELATSVIERDYGVSSSAKPSFSAIVKEVARRYQVRPDEIVGSSRKAPIAFARHVAIYVARELTHDSWKHLGNQFGNRDHTSMMHGYRKISELIGTDKDVAAAVQSIMRNIYPEP